MSLNVDVRHPRFWAVVHPEAELKCLASGFQFLEGPAWHPGEQHLTFSDIPADCLYRWDAPGGPIVLRQPSHMANGSTCDRQGRLLSCEHAASRVTRAELDGSTSVLASHYEGLELNSPNDIVVKSDGSVYFSDPNFGRRAGRVGCRGRSSSPARLSTAWIP